MNKTVLMVAFLLMNVTLVAQKEKKPAPAAIKIPMEAGKWSFAPGSVEFTGYQSVPAMRLRGSRDTAILKDVAFTNGTIEYDIAPQDSGFTSCYFRRQNNKECECFYLRVFTSGIPGMMTSVQYAPFIDGVNCWNLLPYCQGPASFKMGQWNHVKLIVSGEQMLAYVNDMHRPALTIAKLEGNATSGAIGFDGKSDIANLVITPNATDGLSPVAGFDPFYSDPRYLRQWQVSEPRPLPNGRELTGTDLPGNGTQWTSVTAERLGLVNLTRKFGASKNRRVVWLKCRLKVPQPQIRRVDFGFANEVWVFLNGKMVMVDKNLFDDIVRKQPKGRCSIENTFFNLPLQAGYNDILIGVSNDFYGWGIIARFDSMEGIEVMND